MIYEHTHYKNFLKATLADRVAENEAYSLRAFAQKLGFANSYLSEVFSGKKDLSMDAAMRIAVKLELTDQETQYFCLLVQHSSEKDEVYKNQLADKLTSLKPDRKVFDLSSDAFRVISDWYHFAILELTFLHGFTLTAETAAEKLGVSKIESEAAIERLIRLELLTKAPNGKLFKTQDYVLTQSSVPNAAIKKFHKQLLQSAVKSIDAQSPDKRVSSSDVIPISRTKVSALRKLVDQFSSDILKLSRESKVKDDVYCVSVHGFSLTALGVSHEK